MKNREIQGMELGELKSKLSESRKELIKLNAQVATGTTLKSPGEIKKIKKTIARIMGVMKQQKSKLFEPHKSERFMKDKRGNKKA